MQEVKTHRDRLLENAAYYNEIIDLLRYNLEDLQKDLTNDNKN